MGFQATSAGIIMLCSSCFVGILSFIEVDRGKDGIGLAYQKNESEQMTLIFSRLKDKCVKFSLSKETHKLTSLRWWDKPEGGCRWEEWRSKNWIIGGNQKLNKSEMQIVDYVCNSPKWDEFTEFIGLRAKGKPLAWYTTCLALGREFEKQKEN